MKRIRRGLTLIEMVVVVAILGLLMSFTINSLMNFIMPPARDVADKFKAALFYCYQTAILNNSTVIMEIDIDKAEYIGYKLVRGDAGIEKKKVLKSSFPFNNKILSISDIRGIKIESGIFTVPFTHFGVSEDYNFHVGSDTAINRTIQLFKYNGRIEVKPGEDDRTSGAGTDSKGSESPSDSMFQEDEKFE